MLTRRWGAAPEPNSVVGVAAEVKGVDQSFHSALKRPWRVALHIHFLWRGWILATTQVVMNMASHNNHLRHVPSPHGHRGRMLSPRRTWSASHNCGQCPACKKLSFFALTGIISYVRIVIRVAQHRNIDESDRPVQNRSGASRLWLKPHIVRTITPLLP